MSNVKRPGLDDILEYIISIEKVCTFTIVRVDVILGR